MRYQTELMRSILTNSKAQEIIDYVSPIYGNSYVGLWLFQAIGTALSELCAIAEQMRYETTASTADLLLDQWERQYGIKTDASLTKEQRRANITAKILTRGPVTPARLSAAVSAALGGVEVQIKENVDTNTFQVNVMDSVDSLAPAIEVLDRLKPAHLIYRIRVIDRTYADTDVKIAIATTHAVKYTLEVPQ